MIAKFSRWRRSITFRYLGIASLLLIVFQLLLGLLHVHQQHRLNLANLEKRAEGQAEFLSAMSPEAILKSDFLTLERLMRQASEDPDIVYAVVTDRQEKPLTRFLDRENPSIADAIASAATPGEMTAVLDRLQKNSEVREIHRPIESGGELLGKLRLGYSSANLWADFWHETVTIAIALMVEVLLLAALTTLLFDREVRRPLKEVASLAAAIASGQFDRRANPRRNDEIGELNIAFNRMAVQLQQTLQQLAEANQDLELRVRERTATLADTNKKLEREVRDRLVAEAELQDTLTKLTRTQAQLIQSEKMLALGELVSGVAHEINNPINFIYGNLAYAQEYTQNLFHLVKLYQAEYPHPTAKIQDEIETIDLDFLWQDFPKVLNSMQLGTKRIRQIVISLRNFSRLDESELKEVNIHEGIDSTLTILQGRLKAKSTHPAIATVKDYGQLPHILCYPGQLNQVFMNLLCNSIDALEQQSLEVPNFSPKIAIQTQVQTEKTIAIRISDNGIGVPQSVQPRIFDPFFTTKDVGKGTGLGLSISYQIIVEKHKGTLRCLSSAGQGTAFIIEIPIR